MAFAHVAGRWIRVFAGALSGVSRSATDPAAHTRPRTARAPPIPAEGIRPTGVFDTNCDCCIRARRCDPTGLVGTADYQHLAGHYREQRPTGDCRSGF